MGISKTITIKELLKGNKRFCLSPLRALNKCYKCSEYEKKLKQKDGSIKVPEALQKYLKLKVIK